MAAHPPRPGLLRRPFLLALLSGGSLLCAAALTPLEAGAAQQAICAETAPRTRTCRVDEPNVTQRLTDYPAVRLQPGDVVTVAASGCVRTGQDAATWKRYVDPQGPRSDQLYFGLINIPGVTNGPVRLQSVLQSPLRVPAAPAGVPIVQLGYEDDFYGDNGYDRREGITGQCQGLGPAAVILTIQQPGAAVTPAATAITPTQAPVVAQPTVTATAGARPSNTPVGTVAPPAPTRPPAPPPTLAPTIVPTAAATTAPTATPVAPATPRPAAGSPAPSPRPLLGQVATAPPAAVPAAASPAPRPAALDGAAPYVAVGLLTLALMAAVVFGARRRG